MKLSEFRKATSRDRVGQRESYIVDQLAKFIDWVTTKYKPGMEEIPDDVIIGLRNITRSTWGGIRYRYFSGGKKAPMPKVVDPRVEKLIKAIKEGEVGLLVKFELVKKDPSDRHRDIINVYLVPDPDATRRLFKK